MADRLAVALDKIQEDLESVQNGERDLIDDILDKQMPRKVWRRSKEELRQELEDAFLTPSAFFSAAWLNKLQQCVPSSLLSSGHLC